MSEHKNLVGMTEGAKKRAMRLMVSLNLAPLLARSGETPSQTARRTYRPGERLRPCPGCPMCRPDAAEILNEDSWYLHDPSKEHPCDYSCGEVIEGDACDASGVLPARGQRP